MARPTKLTPHIERAIVKALRDGNTREASAESVGIHRSQFYRWLDRSATFRDAVMRAEAQAEVRAVKTLGKAFEDGDWRAAVEWLKRRRPTEWAETQRVEIVNSVRELARQAGATPEEEAAAVAEAERYLSNLRQQRAR